MVPLAVEAGAHVQKRRQEARRHLILQSPPERPCAGGIQVDRVHIGDEDVDGAPQRYRQSFRVPGIVGHVELLKQDLFNAREGVNDVGVGSMKGDRGIVVIERRGQPQRRDRRTKPPSEMTEALDKMRRQPEVIGAQLTVVLALAQRRVGESLTVRVDQLVFLQFVVERERIQ